MPYEGSLFLARRHVPKLDRPVPASRGQRLAVRAECHSGSSPRQPTLSHPTNCLPPRFDFIVHLQSPWSSFIARATSSVISTFSRARLHLLARESVVKEKCPSVVSLGYSMVNSRCKNE